MILITPVVVISQIKLNFRPFLKFFKVYIYIYIYDESRNLPRPNMIMDEQWAINETFNAEAITIGRSKEDNSSEVSISQN